MRNVNKRIELLFGEGYGLNYQKNDSGGVTVVIHLPYQTEIKKEHSRRRADVYRVLIVDDEKMIRMGMKNAIDWKKLGVDDVFTAASGNEAFEDS